MDSGGTQRSVVELIEYVCRCLAVDRERVYLTGYSMGGCGAWEVASYDPSRFAAIVPICGGGDASQAERLKNMSIWAFHGDKDDVVPLRVSEEMVEAVKQCGGQPRFTVYRGYGHEMWSVTYQDSQLYEWLIAQHRGQTPNQSPIAAK